MPTWFRIGVGLVALIVFIQLYPRIPTIGSLSSKALSRSVTRSLGGSLDSVDPAITVETVFGCVESGTPSRAD